MSVYRLRPFPFIRCWQPIINTSIPHSVCFIVKCCSQYCFDNKKVSMINNDLSHISSTLRFHGALPEVFMLNPTIKDINRVNFYYLKHYKWKVAMFNKWSCKCFYRKQRNNIETQPKQELEYENVTRSHEGSNAHPASGYEPMNIIKQNSELT